MKYEQIYSRLIDRAKTRKLYEYTEIHHIIPKCIGGTDDIDNLVRLTPEEHYVAHQLLVKIYPNHNALVHAAVMMRPNRPTNKIYGWLKRKHSNVQSERQTGQKNSQYGKKWIHLVSQRKNIRINKDTPIPDGWVAGRVLNWDKTAKLKNSKPIDIEKNKARKKRLVLKRIRSKHYAIKRSQWYKRAKTQKFYKEFKNSNISLRQFAEQKNIAVMTLSNWFNQYIEEYAKNVTPRKSAKKQISNLRTGLI